jgi:hypothetical protein
MQLLTPAQPPDARRSLCGGTMAKRRKWSVIYEQIFRLPLQSLPRHEDGPIELCIPEIAVLRVH